MNTTGTNKQLQYALDYINYCIHEGMDVDITDLTEKEIIELATNLQDSGDAAYDAWKERDI